MYVCIGISFEMQKHQKSTHGVLLFGFHVLMCYCTLISVNYLLCLSDETDQLRMCQ